MLTEKELKDILSKELRSMTGESFVITYYILDQIINNFKKAGLIKDE